MKRRYLIIVGAIFLILVTLWGVWYLSASNLLRSTGIVKFSAGSKGMNRLEITGPYGWYCMEYTKVPTQIDSPVLQVAGKGFGNCPLFGADVILSTDYPAIEKTQNIVLDQSTMVYQNSSKTYEIYVWITKDRSNFDRLEEIANQK